MIFLKYGKDIKGNEMWMKYDVFSPRVMAFSTERGSGIEPDSPYSGFNANAYCGDDERHISDCRKELCGLMGINGDSLIMPHQVHGVVVANIDKGDAVEGVDAVMTSLSGVCIGVSTADCIPVLLHDSRNDVVCAVHSGWRGTVQHIAAKALEAMAREFGTDRRDVVAAIGPGIRLENFEVGNEVYAAFQDAGFRMEEIACRREKWHIDLVGAVKSDLVGVKSVYDCGICTYSQYHRFFSARRLGVSSGRIFNGIMLKTKTINQKPKT